jgi:hypothetical protein
MSFIRKSPWLGLLLLAAAMFSRVLLPAGWMPTVDTGGVRIALCSGISGEYLTLERDGQLHKHAPSSQLPSDPCPFGLASGPLLDVLVLAHSSIFAAIVPQPALTNLAKIVRRALPPPARAPPELA